MLQRGSPAWGDRPKVPISLLSSDGAHSRHRERAGNSPSGGPENGAGTGEEGRSNQRGRRKEAGGTEGRRDASRSSLASGRNVPRH